MAAPKSIDLSFSEEFSTLVNQGSFGVQFQLLIKTERTVFCFLNSLVQFSFDIFLTGQKGNVKPPASTYLFASRGRIIAQGIN